MGSVYYAEHVFLNTPAAIKVLRSDLNKDAVSFERFRREALVCNQLRHPNIVFVTDFGCSDVAGLYLVMEFLQGVSLYEVLHKQSLVLNAWQAITVASQICKALEAAHSLSILHRDLKPDNIFITNSLENPSVKVFDFGIARMLNDEGPRLTEAGVVLGTPEYIAPENMQQGQNVGLTADLYALGVILFEMLTGEPPFRGSSPMELIRLHVMEPPPLLSTRIPELADSKLEALICQLLAKFSAERPASATVTLELLDEALLELQAKNYPTAFPSSHESVEQQSSAKPTFETRARLSGTMSLLQQSTQETKISRFFHTIPGSQMLPFQLFFFASWGLLLQDLNNQPAGSALFQNTLQYLSQMLVDLIYSCDESDDVEELRQLLHNALDSANQLLSDKSKEKMWEAVEFLSSHELFPAELRPETKPKKKQSWRKKLGEFFSS